MTSTLREVLGLMVQMRLLYFADETQKFPRVPQVIQDIYQAVTRDRGQNLMYYKDMTYEINSDTQFSVR